MKTALVMVDDDRLPDLDHVLAELVGFTVPYRKVVGGFRFTLDSLQVDVRVVATGGIWYGVWASRCTPLSAHARELLAANGPRRRR